MTLKQALHELLDARLLVEGTVTSVDGQLVTVQPKSSETTVTGRLLAVEADDGYMLLTPAVDSTVWLATIDQTTGEGLVVSYTELDKVQVQAPAIELGKDTLEKAVLGETLKTKLEELIDAILAITVPTALGPSGTPINAAQFSTIKSQLDQILSNVNTLD